MKHREIELPFDSLDLVPVERLIKPVDVNQSDNLSANNESTPKLHFWVPAYQRGYRWDEDQVTQLIEDLVDFNENYGKDDNAFYCLQPVVVKPTTINKDTLSHLAEDSEQSDEYLEVIDGQQRLTTILLILQVIFQLKFEKFTKQIGSNLAISNMPNSYEIKYETREASDTWLGQLIKIPGNAGEKEQFGLKNCDYFHFAEVYDTAYKMLSKLDYEEFEKILTKRTYVIWFVPDKDSSGSNAEIFDRINDGKIGLNDAELIKALFLQKSNIPFVGSGVKEELNPFHANSVLESIALEWNNIEKRLQDKEFWGFIYRSQWPYSYDVHIEYLFDLIRGRDESKKLKKNFTFNSYLSSFREERRTERVSGDKTLRMKWVKRNWEEVKQLFDTLNEWFADREIYHRIGYLLEYGKECTVMSLKDDLKGKKRTKKIELLDKKIQESLDDVKWEKLFYKEAALSKVLFLYNIILEDKRFNKTARFSFADYKQVRKEKGWDQEHVASHSDYEPKRNSGIELSEDIIELLTGKKPVLGKGPDGAEAFVLDPDALQLLDGDVETDNTKNKEGSDVLTESILCEEWLKVRNELESDDISGITEKIKSLYGKTLRFFGDDKDSFGTIDMGKTQKEEKDFIWNFVLLNSSTNRSYGNHIFPVKRRRILQDEFKVYTPVGTRYVFEKVYAKRGAQMFSWTRTDAMAYWEDIRKILKAYISLGSPFS